MMNANEVNELQARLLARFVALRTSAFRFEAGVDFARNAAAGWREKGLPGVAAACFDLAGDLENEPGSYDLYAEARALAVAMA